MALLFHKQTVIYIIKSNLTCHKYYVHVYVSAIYAWYDQKYIRYFWYDASAGVLILELASYQA